MELRWHGLTHVRTHARPLSRHFAGHKCYRIQKKNEESFGSSRSKRIADLVTWPKTFSAPRLSRGKSELKNGRVLTERLRRKYTELPCVGPATLQNVSFEVFLQALETIRKRHEIY